MTPAEALLQALIAALSLIWTVDGTGHATNNETGQVTCVQPSPCANTRPLPIIPLGPPVTPAMVGLDGSLIVCPVWKVCP